MGHVAVPAGPGAVLVVSHAEEGLALEEGALDGPAQDGDLDHRLERAVLGGIAEDVLGLSLLVLGLGTEEEEPDGRRGIQRLLGNQKDPESGDEDPFDAKGGTGTDNLRPGGLACELLHGDRGPGKAGSGFSSPTGSFRSVPDGTIRKNADIGADRGKVRESGRNVVEEGSVRAQAGIDPDPGDGERTALVSLFEKLEGDLVLGPEGFGLRHAGLLSPLCVVGLEPDLREVEPGIEKGVPPIGHEAQEDPGLAIGHLSQMAAVLGSDSDRLGPLLGELGGIEGPHGGGLRGPGRQEEKRLPLVKGLQERVIHQVIRDEALKVPDAVGPFQEQGDGFDALSAQIGQKSQGVKMGIAACFRFPERGSEVLAEALDLPGDRLQILLVEDLVFFEKGGVHMVGLGKDDPDRRGSGRLLGKPGLLGRRRCLLLAGAPDNGIGRRQETGLDAEVRRQGVKVHILDLPVSGVMLGTFARPGEPLALSQADEARRPIAGSRVVGGIDVALHQPGGIAEPLFPVGGKTPEHLSQEMGGQVADPDARQDEEPAVVDDPVPQELPLLGAPADMGVPDLKVGSRGGKGQGAHDRVVYPGQILDLSPGKLLVPQRMMLTHDLVPKGRLLGSRIHGEDRERSQALQGSPERGRNDSGGGVFQRILLFQTGEPSTGGSVIKKEASVYPSRQMRVG